MTIGTSTVNVADTIEQFITASQISVTGPVAGVWTVTVPDSFSQADLDSAIAAAVAAKTAATNKATLLTSAASALAMNNAFLALAAPTNAQVLAQTKILTRELNALIKLAVGSLSDTVGT